MSVKIGDTVYFVKRKHEDIFFKHGSVQGYTSATKEMILKGIVSNIKDDNITIKLADNKKSEVKEKEVKVKETDLLTKTTIPAKLLGVWS